MFYHSWQTGLKDEGAMTQLAELSQAKGIQVFLWVKSRTHKHIRDQQKKYRVQWITVHRKWVRQALIKRWRSHNRWCSLKYSSGCQVPVLHLCTVCSGWLHMLLSIYTILSLNQAHFRHSSRKRVACHCHFFTVSLFVSVQCVVPVSASVWPPPHATCSTRSQMPSTSWGTLWLGTCAVDSPSFPLSLSPKVNNTPSSGTHNTTVT